MANYDNSPTSPNKSKTKTGSVTPKKTKTTPPAPGSVPKSTYDWGDGKGSAHTISLKDHKVHVEAKALEPYDIGAGYDPRQVRDTVNSAEDNEYGQPILTQNQQIAASEHRSSTDIPAWYQQYIDALTSARSATAAAYAGAVGASGAPAPAATGDVTADQGANSRAALNNSFANMFQTQGQNQADYYNKMIPNASLLQAGSQIQEGTNHTNLVAQLGQLQKQKGEYGNTYLENMREKAMTFQSDEDAATAAAAASGQKIDFNKNGIADTVDAANARSTATTSADDNKITKWGYTNAEWRSLKPEDRSSIIAAQKPPASPKENTKDYYGHTWEGNGKSDKGWKNMTFNERRSAQKAWSTKTKKSGTGLTTGQQNTAESAFRFALDYYRNPKNKGAAVGDLTGTAAGNKVAMPYTIARIMNHWATNGGMITPQEYNQLIKAGISPDELKGHVKG